MSAQRPTRTRAVLLLAALGVVGALWLGGAVAAPLVAPAQPTVARLLAAGYAPICHQKAERCLLVDGRPMALCARCTGIGVGFLVGVAAVPLAVGLARRETPSFRWLVVAAAPTVVDKLVEWSGLWPPSAGIRLLSGAVLGAVVAPFVFAALNDLLAHGGRTTPALRPRSESPEP